MTEKHVIRNAETDRTSDWIKRKERVWCPWHDGEVMAHVISKSDKYGPANCMMTNPWRYWCPRCRFAIPSEDSYFDEFPGIDPAEWLARLRDEWAARQQGKEAT